MTITLDYSLELIGVDSAHLPHALEDFRKGIGSYEEPIPTSPLRETSEEADITTRINGEIDEGDIVLSYSLTIVTPAEGESHVRETKASLARWLRNATAQMNLPYENTKESWLVDAE